MRRQNIVSGVAVVIRNWRRVAERASNAMLAQDGGHLGARRNHIVAAGRGERSSSSRFTGRVVVRQSGSLRWQHATAGASLPQAFQLTRLFLQGQYSGAGCFLRTIADSCLQPR